MKSSCFNEIESQFREMRAAAKAEFAATLFSSFLGQ